MSALPVLPAPGAFRKTLKLAITGGGAACDGETNPRPGTSRASPDPSRRNQGGARDDASPAGRGRGTSGAVGRSVSTSASCNSRTRMARYGGQDLQFLRNLRNLGEFTGPGGMLCEKWRPTRDRVHRGGGECMMPAGETPCRKAQFRTGQGPQESSSWASSLASKECTASDGERPSCSTRYTCSEIGISTPARPARRITSRAVLTPSTT